MLAGGAALGATQAGMLRALFERGIMPDLLIGTSAGALNAAFCASRPPTVDTADQLAKVWCGVRRGDIFPLHPGTFLRCLAIRRDHIFPGQAMRRLVASYLQFDRLEQAGIPLHVIAFDLLSGREECLSAGPALDAILAAAAVPGVLPPVRWDGRLLADGGVTNNTPISHAVRLGARRIYVLPTENPGIRALRKPPRGALAAGVRAVTVLANARLQDDLARYAPAAELIVLPAANPDGIPPTDFGHAAELIASALAAARTALTAPAAQLAGHTLPAGPRSTAGPRLLFR